MAKKKKIWVTSDTNPFDPFTQDERWTNWDFQSGDGICCALARICGYSTVSLSPTENARMIEIAVQDLLDKEYGESMPTGWHKDNSGKWVAETHMVHYVPAIEGETIPWGDAYDDSPDEGEEDILDE